MCGLTIVFSDFVSTNRLNKNGIRITLRNQKAEHDTSISLIRTTGYKTWTTSKFKGEESMASKTARTIDSIMKKKADPISMKWYDDEVISNQDHKHLDIQKRQRTDSITTSTVHNVNIVTMTEYPVMIKASDGDTILDEKSQSNKTGEAKGTIIVSAL
jgi:hypothetical protein